MEAQKGRHRQGEHSGSTAWGGRVEEADVGSRVRAVADVGRLWTKAGEGGCNVRMSGWLV